MSAPSLPSRSSLLTLYRQLYRAASNFKDYNFRQYARRNVKQKFRANQSLTDPAAIANCVVRGQKDLKMLQRQSLINQLYSSGDSIIEKSNPNLSFSIKTSQSHNQQFQTWLQQASVAAEQPQSASK